MKKISIHLSYIIADGDDTAADTLYQSFQDQFKEAYPDAKLSDAHIEKAAVKSDAEQGAEIEAILQKLCTIRRKSFSNDEHIEIGQKLRKLLLVKSSSCKLNKIK